MSGHSKWAGIKHKKALIDAERGKIFSRLAKEIIASARAGGADLASNLKLRTAVEAAKEANMPSINIDRAIKRGTGELEGVNYESHQYEGYGPGGVAILVEVLTDNKNRCSSELRFIFSKNGGNFGEAGCVSWMFETKGVVTIERDKVDEDKLMGIVLDAGGEDLRGDYNAYEVITQPQDLEKVKKAISDGNIPISLAEVTMVPKNYVKLTEDDAHQILRLIEAIEDHDDVQHVYANFDVPDEIVEKFAEKK